MYERAQTGNAEALIRQRVAGHKLLLRGALCASAALELKAERVMLFMIRWR
jgi:hypothetical protein